MTISSRTPEGLPHRCPICGNVAFLEPCYPGGDAVCPSCGHLFSKLCSRIADNLGVNLDAIILNSHLTDEIGFDSLDFVECAMEVEEEFDITIPDDVAARFRTLGDVIEYIRRIQEGD
jgi:acyl carrier protein